MYQYHLCHLYHRLISPTNFLRLSLKLIIIDCIDYHWLSLIIIDYHWLWLIIIYYNGLSLIIIDNHCLSLIIFVYHWLSLFIIDYLKSEQASLLGCNQYLIPKFFEDDEINRLNWVSNTCINQIRAITQLICPSYNCMQIWDILRSWATQPLQSKDEKHFFDNSCVSSSLAGWVHCQRRPNCHSIEITPLPPHCCAVQSRLQIFPCN